MEKPKNLYVQPMDMNFGEWECCRVREEVDKGGGEIGTTVIA